MLLNSNSIHPITTKLLFWYSQNKRDLPWRDDPIPYNVWLSEIVFQQTRIDQGMSYYINLIDKYPNVYDLAKAEERDVLKVWEGLGYYSRARNLHQAAKTIVNEYSGNFPDNYEDILSLKGVGPYTAAAISSIAFSIVKPAIDGNVLRVSSRLFQIEEPIDKANTKKIIEKELVEIIDTENPGDFNQAMMELGATICKPKNPLCENCPISTHCLTFHSGKQNQLPVKSKKQGVKKVYFNFLVIKQKKKLIIEKRNSGIWNGLYQFPLIESETSIKKEEIIDVLKRNSITSFKTVVESQEYKHLLSHRTIYAKFWMLRPNKELSIESTLPIAIEDLIDYPMPRLIHNFLESEEANQFLLM